MQFFCVKIFKRTEILVARAGVGPAAPHDREGLPIEGTKRLISQIGTRGESGLAPFVMQYSSYHPSQLNGLGNTSRIIIRERFIQMRQQPDLSRVPPGDRIVPVTTSIGSSERFPSDVTLTVTGPAR